MDDSRERDAAKANGLDPLLTLADLARYSGESTEIWRRRCLAGELRSLKLGRNVRIQPADLDAYLRRKAREPVCV